MGKVCGGGERRKGWRNTVRERGAHPPHLAETNLPVAALPPSKHKLKVKLIPPALLALVELVTELGTRRHEGYPLPVAWKGPGQAWACPLLFPLTTEAMARGLESPAHVQFRLIVHGLRRHCVLMQRASASLAPDTVVLRYSTLVGLQKSYIGSRKQEITMVVCKRRRHQLHVVSSHWN